MGIRQSVFSLEEIYGLQVEGNWSTRDDVWLTPSPFTIPVTQYNTGYHAGGYNITADARVVTVERFDFSNDTTDAVPACNLPSSKSTGANQALGNQSYGYTMGGSADPGIADSIVVRIDYSNDSSAPAPGAETWIRLLGSSGASNSNYGYLFGGWSNTTSPTGPYTAISRFDFSNDTSPAPIHNNFVTARVDGAAAGNQTHGYYGGGNNYPTGPYVSYSIVDRLDYANDTVQASPKGPLSAAKYSGMLASGNGSKAYFAGGTAPAIGAQVSTIDRYDYSNDTVTSPPNIWNVNVRFRGNTGDTSGGYYMGGYISSPFTYYSSISRIDYDNDTAALVTKADMISGAYGGFTFASKENDLPSSVLKSATQVRDSGASPQGSDFGYILGGNSSPTDAVERMDFNNDTTTASPKGTLILDGRYRHAAVSSASGGYIAGGRNLPANAELSSVERIDYANDTANMVAKGTLNGTRYAAAAAGNQTHGYVGGGQGTPNKFTKVDRIDYSNDTVAATPVGDLIDNHFFFSAVGNQNFGYFAGAWTTQTSIDRVDYSNDTVAATPVGKMSLRSDNGNGFTAATGNANFGYIGGGGFGGDVSTVDRIDYANDTANTSVRGPLVLSRYGRAATGDQNFGYFSGGGGTDTSSIDRIDYANDTVTSTPKSFMVQNRQQHGATSSRENAMPLRGPGILDGVSTAFISHEFSNPQGTDFGYFAGGAHPSVSDTKATVQRVDFTNDTATAPSRGQLDDAVKNHGGASSTTGGYTFGNFPARSWVQRINYSNDTATAATKGNLNVTKGYVSSTGNEHFGYTIGGGPSPLRTTVDRLDYSNDSADASARRDLTNGRGYHSSVGNQDFGYACGGHVSGIVSTVVRVNYANDLAAEVPRGPLTATRRYNSGTGNANFGYVAGNGSHDNTQVDRIDYSNDTVDATPKGPLTGGYSYHAATSNPDFGYFGGGQNPGTTVHSTVDRINYANDLVKAIAKGPLSIPTNKSAGVSSRAHGNPLLNTVTYTEGTISTANIGYFGGSSTSNENNRIDLDNDTATIVTRGTLAQSATVNQAGTSNGSFGYISGGSPANRTSVNRIDYSNDTTTASLRGPLNTGRRDQGGVGNANFGYVAGGEDPSGAIFGIVSIERIDYSSDNTTTVAKGPLSVSRKRLAGTGNQNFGYFGGGALPERSTVERIDYSNDVANATPKGPLSATSQYLGATGNANFGYFGGGRPSPASRVDRIDYANDTIQASPRGNFEIGLEKATANASNSNFGYFGGGSNLSSVRRIDFSNDTATPVLRGPLTRNMVQEPGVGSRSDGFVPIGPSVVSNAAAMRVTPPTTFGYFAGGEGNSSPGARVDRIDYSNDTAALSIRGDLAVGTKEAGSFSSPFFGYVVGGYVGNRSIVQRIDYANDSATGVTRALMNFGRRHVRGTGNKDFGYVFGGNVPSPRSDIERVDYSNDGNSTLMRGNLTGARYRNVALGNQVFGFAASSGGNGGVKSDIQRLDYSNDTTDAVVKANLGVQRYSLGGTGNSVFGFLGGGYGGTSILERITYASDTLALTPKSNLNIEVGDLAATGNVNFGYFGGGSAQPASNTPGGGSSKIDRLDYSNDTIAPAGTVGNLSLGRRNITGFSAAESANPQ